MITIDVTESDRESGGLAPQRRAAALEALRVDGGVVLADAVDLEHLDVLHERMIADVLLNPQAIAVTSALLGPGVKNVMYSGNTALSSESRQLVHVDTGQLWPEEPRPMIAMVHTSGWLAGGDPLLFPVGTESFFDHPVLTTAARFTDEPIDHINTPGGHTGS